MRHLTNRKRGLKVQIEKEMTYLWEFMIALVGFVVWLIRLEGKVQMNMKKVDELKEYQQTEIGELKEAVKELSVTTNKLRTIVAKLEGIITKDRCLLGKDGINGIF